MVPDRSPWLDTLRGVAVLWMTVFHFSFDLNHFGWIHQDFYRDPLWTGQRTAILSLFLFCAGYGQAIAVQTGQSWARFWRRWRQIALCALGVSAGSVLMFPHSWIYFGVLHGMALMLLIGRATATWGACLWPLGLGAILLGRFSPDLHAVLALPAALDGKALNWLGLIHHKPITEDYVPLLPWLGVLWWGVAAGQHPRQVLPARVPTAAPLAWLGGWSLTWYMLHQPVLIGVLSLVQWLR